MTSAIISLFLAGARLREAGGLSEERTRWRERAACRQADAELFFSAGSTAEAVTEIHEAKALCAACPVQRPCLTYAVATGQEFGIWGGYDENERRLLAARWRRSRTASSARSERRTTP